jgi:NAD(P)-dependent dehydrogenase (short-subunit alcohol dehydrogenase family)
MSGMAGKVAVVTGGSSGIGRAVVDSMADAGTLVVYCAKDGRPFPAAERTGVTPVVADVTRSDDMARVVRIAVERHGGLDILVCCAGMQTYGTAEDTSEEDWRKVLDVNLTGAFLAAKHAIPWLRRRGGGAIVNVSSVQGRAPKPRVLGYSVSKAGIDALTRSLAVDHAADNIRVNAVAPGPVDTPLLQVRDPKAPPAGHRPRTGGRRPRVAKAEEVAKVILFLAGPSASYVTGASYLVDGGIMTGQSPVLLEEPAAHGTGPVRV